MSLPIIINNQLNTGGGATQSSAGKDSALGDSQVADKSSNTAKEASRFGQRERDSR